MHQLGPVDSYESRHLIRNYDDFKRKLVDTLSDFSHQRIMVKTV